MDVPMPGMAYTLPRGHHLDLQVSTASLMHSNARTPAQAEVQVAARIPARLPAASVDPPAGNPPVDGTPPSATAPDPAPAPAAAAAPAAQQATLPTTGTALPMVVPLAMLALAAVGRRR